MADTGFKSPSTTGTVTDTWINPTNAYASDDTYTTKAADDSSLFRQDYGGFGFNIPAGATINGIEVGLEGKASSNDTITIRIWDGSAWKEKTQALTTSDTGYTLGGATDVWSGDWVQSDFADGTFFAELQTADIDFNTFSVDHIQIKVYYTEAVPDVTVTPTVLTLVSSVPTYSIVEGTGVSDLQTVLTLVSSIPTYSVSGDATISQGLLSLVSSIPAYSISLDATVKPSLLTTYLVIQTYIINYNIIMPTLTTLKTFAELLLDDSINDDLFIDLANLSKNLIEDNGNDWEILKAFDSTQSSSPSDTYLTMKDLPTSFRRLLNDNFIFVGEDSKYYPVPFENRYKYRSSHSKFYIDHANSEFAVIGSPSSAKTIYFPYIKTSDDFDELGDSWGFPSRFHQLLAINIVGIIMNGVDADDIYRGMAPEYKELAREIRKAMDSWNTSLSLGGMDNSSDDFVGDGENSFRQTLNIS